MRVSLVWVAFLVAIAGLPEPAPAGTNTTRKVYILPIRDDIMPPLVYLVRRGVKEAMEAQADLLVLDMETNGGRVDTTREIIGILNQFKGDTATYVNKDAFSAGAFIAVATKKIYMAPESVIGAAAPVILSPGGNGVERVPDTYESKMTSAVRAMVRTSAEKNGYNIAVVEAMIDKTRGLTLTNVVDGVTNQVVIARQGEILTLTNTEAEREYGNPPKKLLSSGTVKDLDELLKLLGYAGAQRHEIKPTGMERLGTWLNTISPLLLIIGVIGIYIEFKTPGFGLAGIIGIAAFALYFLGGYVSGLSGAEWVIVFIAGLALVVVELFVYPGTVALGLLGAVLMLTAIIMAMVDVYPASAPGLLPALPSLDKFELPMRHLLVATVGGGLGIWLASRFLPRTPVYRAIVSQSASGVQTEAALEQQKKSRQGQVGITISALRPGGKAQFGEEIVDVISQGEMVPKGTQVRIIGSSGSQALVEVLQNP
ncbi:MAG TPA: NfeD family protein [Candidatus Binatia bacterium]|nr:NfeD family protein [Candidatus Binatia bacterium]